MGRGLPDKDAPRVPTGRGGSVAPADPNASKGVFPTAHGTVKSIAGSQLFVEMEEDHEMKFRLIHKTKIYSQSKDGLKEIKASSLKPGETVDIDMQVSLDGAFEAVRVTVVPSDAGHAAPDTQK